MSFSARVKEDMTRIELEKECCKKAEFAAFLRMCGTINIGFGQQVSLNMNTENSQVARRFFTLAKSFFPERQLMVHRKNQLRKNRVYSLLIPPQPALTELLGGGAGLLWRGDPSPICCRISATANAAAVPICAGRCWPPALSPSRKRAIIWR